MVGPATGPGGIMVREVPWRRSLLVRLLATSILIVVCAISATAWLAVIGTTNAMRTAQDRALADDAHIYDLLVGYAATHPSWDGVGQLMLDIARQTGRQVTLTTQDRRLLAESTISTERLPAEASAVVDPLLVGPLLPTATSGRIDPRVVGPYRLSSAEREGLWAVAGDVQNCLRSKGYGTTIVEGPSGRVTVRIVVGDDTREAAPTDGCGVDQLDEPTPTEQRAVDQLTTLVNDCLQRHELTVRVTTSLRSPYLIGPKGSGDHEVQTCLDTGRREQFAAYVAPAALLFVRSPGGGTRTGFDLSGRNVLRIIAAAVLVLAITVAVTVSFEYRLVRPLRALTAAALHPTGRHPQVPVNRSDEIGVLAAAFNNLSDRRERSERQRKAMVSDIAHELRTPLTNIRTWIEAVGDGVVTPASDPMLTSALQREVLQLQHIIDDLQDLAVGDAGGLRLECQRIRVGDLLCQVAAAHRGSADAAGITVTTATTGDPELIGDPVRLRQALGNLVSNAIRYTLSGGIISLYADLDAEYVKISVSDTGTGIPAADLPHVFDRFWRVDRSRTRDTGGSGLGLAIVRQIAESHSGSVVATSTVGQGSTFTLRLPQVGTSSRLIGALYQDSPAGRDDPEAGVALQRVPDPPVPEPPGGGRSHQQADD